jgi:hypothetical protein
MFSLCGVKVVDNRTFVDDKMYLCDSQKREHFIAGYLSKKTSREQLSSLISNGKPNRV